MKVKVKKKSSRLIFNTLYKDMSLLSSLIRKRKPANPTKKKPLTHDFQMILCPCPCNLQLEVFAALDPSSSRCWTFIQQEPQINKRPISEESRSVFLFCRHTQEFITFCLDVWEGPCDAELVNGLLEVCISRTRTNIFNRAHQDPLARQLD